MNISIIVILLVAAGIVLPVMLVIGIYFFVRANRPSSPVPDDDTPQGETPVAGDYLPPENPYESPAQQSISSPKRSNIWVIVLIVALVVIAGGCSLCTLSWWAYRAAPMPAAGPPSSD